MPEPTTAILAKKPISALQKPLKADARGLFKGLLKATAHGVTGKWVDLAPDVGEIAAAVGLETTPEERAWVLIQRALSQALFELVSPNFNLLSPEATESMDSLSAQLDQALEKSKLAVSDDFFARPSELAVLDAVGSNLERWLTDFGMEPARVKTMVERLPSFFTYALHQEWRRHPDLYAPLAQTSPFAPAAKRDAAWDYYSAWLRQQVEESMLEETFGLSQVYVPLRAYYEKERKDSKASRGVDEAGPGREKNSVRVVVDLQTQLDEWLTKGDKHDALRVISGGPGSGKSSFCKMWAARLATERPNLRMLFVPLHLLNPKSDLTSAVGDFVKQDGFLPENPLDAESGESHLLLIFDGLDELAMRGKVAEELARNFVREVEKNLTHRNQRELRLQALLSGRQVVIQSNAAEFRKAGEVLHVLAYHEQAERDDVDPAKLLGEDQRGLWWTKYGMATGKGYTAVPECLLRGDSDEVTAQPLLNYLVALSYERGEIDFSQEVNLNSIYQDLLGAVHERGWEKGRNPATHGMGLEQFIRVLEEIALAAWHGNGRTTTVGEIERHCAVSGTTGLLELFQEGATGGVTRLLTAFYFREHGTEPSGERTFEFTHKSFGEYLTARRIVRAMARMHDELQRRRATFDSGWDHRDALKHWGEVCGPSSLDQYLLRFLRQEVALREKEAILKGGDIVGDWQNMFCTLIGVMLRSGMPMELLSPRTRYHDETRQARNAEEALLAALNACALMTHAVSKIDWPERDSAGAWLSRLGQQANRQGVIVLACLSFLDLQECSLMLLNLGGAHLEGTNLEKANLAGTNFTAANLVEANLEGASLYRSHLVRAHLMGARLRKVRLEGADLESADLEGVDLEGADIEAADLTAASLTAANLEGTNLEKAYNLGTADFKGAVGLSPELKLRLRALGNPSVDEE